MPGESHSRIKRFVDDLDRVDTLLLGLAAGILLGMFLFAPETATTPGPGVIPLA